MVDTDSKEQTAFLELKIEVMRSGAMRVRNVRYGPGSVVVAFLTEAMEAEAKAIRLKIEEYIERLCAITACDQQELRDHLTNVAASTGYEQETVLKHYLTYLEDKREEQKDGADRAGQEDAG